MDHFIKSDGSSAGKIQVLVWAQCFETVSEEASTGQKNVAKGAGLGVVQPRKEKAEMGRDSSFLYIGGCFEENKTQLFASTVG